MKRMPNNPIQDEGSVSVGESPTAFVEMIAECQRLEKQNAELLESLRPFVEVWCGKIAPDLHIDWYAGVGRNYWRRAAELWEKIQSNA